MAVLQNTVKVGKGLWPLIRRFASISFITLILAAILFNSIIASFQEQSLDPLINEGGKRLLTSMEQVNEHSLEIIDPSYDELTLWAKIGILSALVGSFFILYIWFKIIRWIIVKLPISGDSSRDASNIIISLILLILLQIITSLVYNYPPIDAVKLPWDTGKNLVKAIPHIIDPLLGLEKLFSSGE